MKILVFPHDMNMGGSQLNAIELAAAVLSEGHSVCVAGHPGSLQGRVAELGLEFIALPDPGRRPSAKVVKALRRLIAQRGIQVVHGYEWPPALEGLLAASTTSARCAVTVLSMSVAPFIPKYLPLLVGTEQIADTERGFGRNFVSVMEPPVDTDLNNPCLELKQAAPMLHFGIDPETLKIVMVNRLAHEMKLEGILAAIDVVGALETSREVQLIIVGDGPARAEVEAAAHKVNERWGTPRIVLTGQLEDPRWAYQIADVTLGMGGSALRSLAFAKPLIVQGEQGFWRLLTADSQQEFLWQGWYGIGPGPQHGTAQLREALLPLLDDAPLREELGQLGLQLLEARFSLRSAAQRQIAFYESVLAEADVPSRWQGENLGAALRFARYKAGRLMSRVRGTWSADDFNAKPTVVHDRAKHRAVSK